MADRIFSRPIVLLLFFGVATASLCTRVPAFAQEEAETENDPALSDSALSDPAVEQLLLKATGGPEALGRSIDSLARMQVWSAVDQLLSPLAENAPADERASRIASEIGTDQRVRISLATEVSEPAKQALDALFAARKKDLQSPTRLQPAIAKLTSASPDEKLAAYRTLFRGGEAASAALITEIVRTDDPDQRNACLRVLLEIDRSAGINGLRRVALYGTASASNQAIQALQLLNIEEVQIDLLTKRLESSADEDLRASAIRMMRQSLADAMDNSIHTQHDFGNVTAWAINAQRDGVQPTQAATWVLAFRDAADAASRLAKIGDQESSSVIAQLTAQLAYRVANDPDWGDAKNREQFIQSFFADADATAVLQTWTLPVLKFSVQSQNDPAAVGMLRMIDGDLDRSLANALLRNGATASVLVEAVDHPNATVRYEAASAIARLLHSDPQLNFAGMSRVEKRWQQMATLGNRPISVVLENRPEIISGWERIMNSAGYDARIVSTVASLERMIALGDDVRLVVSKREPKDASAIEMIDVVRRQPLGRDIPLLIYSPAIEIEGPEIIEEELDQRTEAQKAFDANLPDQFGVRGGIASLDVKIERSLLYGEVDRDWTKKRELDLQLIGQTRWADESLRAGLIRSMPRPSSAAGLYELLLDSRRREHLPSLTASDRVRYRNVALDALDASQAN
ncbi:hypothetical protein [Rhodopirellula halodulae]|uniref:hypothetical protein n=1 Tax=Rhodopirellula halodulae TaxID=2894198 RepID=UPI001E2AE3C6|nr:hypothetical protein [Rhodopirellula sp. JC737]MCC9655339.1 hypothetical protein [Rhodopirellula sp. JC737]